MYSNEKPVYLSQEPEHDFSSLSISYGRNDQPLGTTITDTVDDDEDEDEDEDDDDHGDQALIARWA